MNNEPCLRVFPKFVVCFSLLLWQLCHGIKFQTTAQSSTGIDELVPQDEATALSAVAKSLGFYEFFSYSAPICPERSAHGFGLSCNCSSSEDKICHINGISWTKRGLKGRLSDEVGKLTHLKQLELSNNEIQGSIPDVWENMSQLKYLDLSNNQLTGMIPKSLGKLKAQLSPKDSDGPFYTYSIVFGLDLSNNHLEGPIPDTLGSITLDLNNNTRGKPLEPNKYSCYYDFIISLNDNHLNGSIPKTLGQLKFLTSLYLQNNLLTGSMPPSLGNLPCLLSLDLSENQLSGSIPRELGNLTSVGSLFFQSNYLTGNLSESFAQLKNLFSFSISGNYLSGPFPHFITNWTSLESLSFYGNSFSGNIPPEIFNFSKSLSSLIISDVGTPPFEFPPSANLSQIKTLVLRSCSITGRIPSYIGNSPSELEYLDLSFNNLTGEIPSSLQRLNLSYMSFAENHLSGPIPAWISRAATWTVIDLSYNEFSDANNLFKPPQGPHSFQPRNPNLNLFSCCRHCNVSTNCAPDMKGVDQLNKKYCMPDGTPKYHSLYINCGGEETKIQGNDYCEDNSTLPYGVSDPRKDQNWAFSSSGSFLSTLSNASDNIKEAKWGIFVVDAPLYRTARLSPVSLKYYGFCFLNGSYNVTLHFAEIVYTGHDVYVDNHLKKRIFDVYIQKVLVARNYHVNGTAKGESEIQRIQNHTVKVENGLLEMHLYWAGKGSSSHPSKYFRSPEFNGPLLSAISVTPNFKVGGGKGLTRSHIAMITLGSITFALFLSLAFAWMMGWLEKEELHDIHVDDENTVTLKELIAATRGFSKDAKIGEGGFGTVYKAELHDKVVAVKKLSSLSKEGIQTLKVGIYNLQTLRHENLVRLLDIHVGKDLCFLVYEYMANKSLADALFERKIELDWDARFKICVEIAKGLQYLHEHRLKIVHWGIKAANILLDDKLKPKISDLGLASASVENDKNESHFLWMMKTEASTGYMAPEYPTIGKESGFKYDVYSFGVVMLEIVCGRKNVGPGQKNKLELEILVDKVCAADKNGRLPSLVDENLSVYDTKQAMTVLKLAMWCTMSASVRPTMTQVVSVLTGEKSLEEISMHASVEDARTTYEDDSWATDPLFLSK